MKGLLVFICLFPVVCFSQVLESKIDLDGRLGVQINDFYATSKGRRPDEVFYFNPILYYRNKYNIGDDEILGVLRGRLTKEEPLSSTTLVQLNELRASQENFTNLVRDYPQYKDAINNYDLFVKIFESSLKKAAEMSSNDAGTKLDIVDKAADDDFEEDYNLDADDAMFDELNDTMNSLDFNEPQSYQNSPASNQNTAEGVLGYLFPPKQESKDAEAFLFNTPQKGVFADQMIKTNIAANSAAVNFIPYPSLEDVVKDSTKSFTEKELEFLIRYEQLTRSYSNAVIEYYQVLEARDLLEKSYYFNPGNTNETFSLLVTAENPRYFWLKTFRLNGKQNYQSYNRTTWYLGYEIPLTKRDLKALSLVFTEAKSASYFVKGRGGEVSFTFSSAQIEALKQLFEDYIDGKMIQPEMQNDVPALFR